MSAKKRVESEEASINVDPFAQNLSAINPDFNLDELISACREKLASESKLKVPIQERIIKNREAIERIKRTIASLEAKTAQQGSQTWIGVVLKPLADQLKGIFPNAVVEIMEPNNMTGAITVTVSKKGASTDKKLRGEDSKALSFIPGDEGLLVKDFSQNSNTYPPGSLGDICLMNFANVSVPADKPIQFLLDYLK